MQQIYRKLKKLLLWVGCLTLLLYGLLNTFYLSQFLIWQMNKLSYPLNMVAAQSQAQARLSSSLTTEPGSPQWLAMSDDMVNTDNLGNESFEQIFTVDEDNNQQTQSANIFDITQQHLKQQTHLKNHVINQYYTAEHGEIIESANPLITNNTPLSPPKNNPATKTNPPLLTPSNLIIKPQVIVVLGGGVMRNAQDQLIVNTYTQKRLATAITAQQKSGLPILLSGSESSYMQAWLKSQGASALFKEWHSLNTCENARFTALLLQKHGGAPTIALVTDIYHMPRARRLFAQNGINIIPIVAPLPQMQSSWWLNRNALVASRRSIYEFIANARDYFFEDTHCREIP